MTKANIVTELKRITGRVYDVQSVYAEFRLLNNPFSGFVLKWAADHSYNSFPLSKATFKAKGTLIFLLEYWVAYKGSV